MPIYEYRCADCGFQNEYLQKVSEPPMTICPSCGKESFRKLLTAAGFQLKGSGWYVTDFKNSGKAATGKAKSDGANEAVKEGAKEGAKSEGTAATEGSTSDTKSESSKSTSSDKGAASASAAS